jgi:outer membrane biosynthesis protein TonB
MFDNLVESNPKNRKLGGMFSSSMWSMIVHGLVIYGAVQATAKVKDVVEAMAADTLTFFISHQNEPEPEPEPEQPQLASLTPPPKGFQTVLSITEIPTEIPPVNLNERFDPRDYTGVGQEGGIASGIEGGTGDVPTDLQAVFVEAVVDEPPILLSRGNLHYPPLLQDAGIEGSVVFEVIIGVDGHPEPESIRIITSTNKLFESPARNVVLGSVFRPGRMRGQPVRVLVRQPISFKIIRR